MIIGVWSTGDIAQWDKCLPGTCKVLSSIASTIIIIIIGLWFEATDSCVTSVLAEQITVMLLIQLKI